MQASKLTPQAIAQPSHITGQPRGRSQHAAHSALNTQLSSVTVQRWATDTAAHGVGMKRSTIKARTDRSDSVSDQCAAAPSTKAKETRLESRAHAQARTRTTHIRNMHDKVEHMHHSISTQRTTAVWGRRAQAPARTPDHSSSAMSPPP